MEPGTWNLGLEACRGSQAALTQELHNCCLFIAALPVFVLFAWPELSFNLHSQCLTLQVKFEPVTLEMSAIPPVLVHIQQIH